MYTPQHPEHDLPHRQRSFIGLPPISPGPEFGSSALGISSAEFGLIGGGDVDPSSSARGAARAGASPQDPPAESVPHQLPPSLPPWLSSSSSGGDGGELASANRPYTAVAAPPPPPSSTHTRAASPSAASGSQSRSMAGYVTQATSAYRPSQGQSMYMQGGAYTVAQQPPQQDGHRFVQQREPVVQSYQNGSQYAVNGDALQQQQQQQQQQFSPHAFQSGGQHVVNGNGNGVPYQASQQQQPQQQQQQQQQQQHQHQQQYQQHIAQPGVHYAVQIGQVGNPQGPKASAADQQYGPSSPAPRGMPSPSLASNGTFILPPGWKAEESHLQQPLSSQRHRASPSISSLRQQQPRDGYEIDKETGALSTRSVSPATQSPTEMRQLQQRVPGPSKSESSQNGFSPPNAPFAQQSQSVPSLLVDQYTQDGLAPPNPPFAHQGGAPLARTATNDAQGSDQPKSKRNSRVFNGIRNRLGGNGSDPATGDGVSDASVLTDEQAREGPASFFFGPRANGQPASEGRASYDPASNRERSYFHPPSEKKRFFTRPNGGMGFGSSGHDHSSRPATSGSLGPVSGIGGMASARPVVGFGPSVPGKSRFSKLSGMLNRDAKPDSQPPQPRGLSNLTHGPIDRPSLTGLRQMGPPGAPVGDGQVSIYHRSRAATAAIDTRPNIGEQERRPTAQGLISPPPTDPVVEQDRGRKTSAGNLLSNIFSRRSESKTRDQQVQQSPPGLGQPQGMMKQGPTPPRPGQYPTFLAHSMGMPGQPPILPPQGQYAGLAQQVQQSQYQQQSHGQSQASLGRSSARLGASVQDGASRGVPPVTQSSGSPYTTQAPGPLSVETRPAPSQQAVTPLSILPVPAQQSDENQGPQSPVSDIQIATAVPIRQVERSPDSNKSGVLSGQDSPQDSTRGRSASVVNQIEVSGPRKPPLDSYGRMRSGSSAASHQSTAQPQHTVHIASLQAPVRIPTNPPSPQNSAHLGPQDNSSIDTENGRSMGHSFQDSPTTRRESQGLSIAHRSNNASQTTSAASPTPSPEQQPLPPPVPPKRLDSSLSRSFRPDPNQSSAPSPSVYRPSAPPVVPVAPVVQQAMPSPPAQRYATSRGPVDLKNGSGQPFRPDQYPAHYTMQGRPPQDMMMISVPSQDQVPEKEGSFSKMLKTSKTFVHEKTSSDKSKGEKGSMSSKLLGAFKKSKQAESKSPTLAPPPSGPPGGPAWVAEPPPQRPAPPNQTQSAPLPLPTPAVVTDGLQQMPSKAQQLLGQPLNAMYQAPADQPAPRVRQPSTERSTSQPFLNYQEERQNVGKTTPPLSPDHIGIAPMVTASPETLQQATGRSSPGSLPGQGSQGAASQQAQQQQPVHPRQSFENPVAGKAAAHSRAENLRQQIAPHDQQYAPVAIPQAYAPVYAGHAAAVPAMNAPAYVQPFAGMLATPYQTQAQQQQQWMYPGVGQGMAMGQMTPNGTPSHMMQQGVYQQYFPYQGTPPPLMNGGYQPPQQCLQMQRITPLPGPEQTSPSGVPMQHQMQHAQSMQQNTEMPAQQESHLQSWEQSVLAQSSSPGQQAQTAPQYTLPSAQQAGSVASQQSTPVPSQAARPPPTTALPAVPPSRQHFVMAPEVVTAPSAQAEDAQPSVHQPSPVQPQADSPPNQSLPRSTFAVQAVPGHDQLQLPQASSGELLPQRQSSGASQVSCMTTEPATVNNVPDAQRAQVVAPDQWPVSVHSTQPASPERQRAPVVLTDEPMPKIDTPLNSPSAEKDDLYGATPRHSPILAPEQYPVQHMVVSEPAQQSITDESASKFAGMPPSILATESKPDAHHTAPPSQQHFTIDSAPVRDEPRSATPSSASLLVRAKSPLAVDEEPPSPTESELKAPLEAAKNEHDDMVAATTTTTTAMTTINGKPVQSSQAIFDEHKRKLLLRDMEEKIAVMPQPAMVEPPRKREEAPLMSATSYPGQEWNPFGDDFEYDDE